MKQRSFFSILAGVVLTLLAVGAGGFYWLLGQSPLGVAGQQGTPTAAIFVPKQAPIVASLLINPDQLAAFRQIATPPAGRRQARMEWQHLQQGLLAGTDLNYERDVQPWVGNELTVAVTTADIDRDGQNGRQPGYLLAIATKDADRSREFLQVFWQKQALAGVDLVFEQYKGVKLIYGNSPDASQSDKRQEKGKPSGEDIAPGLSLASAAVGNQFVLFANHPRVLRDAINNVQAEELALASSPTYQTAIANLTENRIGLVYVNLPHWSDWLGGSSRTNLTNTLPPTYESLAIAPGIAPGGLRAETLLLTAPGQSLMAYSSPLAKPVQALQYIPADSLLAAGGTNLNHLWQQVSQSLTGYPSLASRINRSLTGLQQLQPLDLPTDVFSWVQGEFALGLLPHPHQSQSDWIFVAQRSADTGAAITHLDELAQRQGFSVGSLTLGTQTVSAWTRLTTSGKQSRKQRADAGLEAQVQGLHATIADYEIFATSIEAMTAALQAPQAALLTDPHFARAANQLPQPNDGYLFINWVTGQRSLEAQFPLLRLLNIAGQPFFNHLQSLTFSSSGSEAQLQRGQVFISVK
ncbi:hypothetical protein BST81_17410 [Leptolyngbya sp. 'hensonii']|uniref:DUF3352 domain-containing protein n=1 Tax=Leptolyngbya sp. 'hensonii' TaxID=1922337 RepID=UPI00095029A2|nr:DUF3352 domain-containing protein [Leptolyngbya sp. 'hensonii']OLP17129.1 hypothetical protein BST81_17410 [Leptolyngbya sp. 'hensonii']